MSQVELPKEGFVVQFEGDGEWEGRLFRIKSSEGLQYATGDTTGSPEFSTVATNASTGYKDIKVLEPSKNPLRAAFVQMGFKDGLNYTVKLKAGSIRYGPDHDLNSAVLTSVQSPYFDPDDVYSMWLVWDWYPSIQAQNTTPFTVTPKVWFTGVKFDLEEITNGQEISRLKSIGRITTLTLGGNHVS